MTTISPANIAVRYRNPTDGLKGNPGLTGVSNPNANSRLQSKTQSQIVPPGYSQRTLHSEKSKLADSSTLGARRSAITPTTVQYKGYGDDKKTRDIRLVPCSHRYCHNCLKRLVRIAITDETLFPLQCCRYQVLLEAFQAFITPELAQAFINKKIEFDTPNKLYCSALRSLVAPKLPTTWVHAMSVTRRRALYANQQLMGEEMCK